MALVYKEAGFPGDYRETNVRQIMSALYKLRSIAVNGLAGMGKSNVVRFVVSHPQVRLRYLKERANDYAFVHVDCAGLAGNHEAELLSEIAIQMRSEGLTTGDSFLPAETRSLRRALKEQVLALPPALNLVLALDYFDEAAAALDHTFFNYLFHLRNSRPRGNLAYIFATRRPVDCLYELHELLDESCFIGPFNVKDAQESLRRDEARLGCIFEPGQRDRLIACTGGHPGFLKNTAELAAGGQVDLKLPDEAIARQVLQADQIKRLAEELWHDLTPAEQGVLINTAGAMPAAQTVDEARLTYLQRSGLLKKRNGPNGRRVALFCPLLDVFVREFKSPHAGTVRITAIVPNQARIETPAGVEYIKLPPLLFALLLALTQAGGEILDTDDLIARVYGDEAAGVTNTALSQLVKRLREILDPPARRMVNDPGYTCIETIRDIGYRLKAGCTTSPPQ